MEKGDGDVVQGMVYMVEGDEQLGMLAAWEGENYEVQRCEILYEGGDEVQGCVFVFCGNEGDLRDVVESA